MDNLIPHRILVCEDDQVVSKILYAVLSKAGYEVDVAGNAAEAKALLDNNQYLAMTLDILLPDQNGLSLLQEIREDSSRQYLPVIIVSAIPDGCQRELQVGSLDVVNWLEKPVDCTRLIASLKSTAMWPEGQQPRLLHIEKNRLTTQQLQTSLESLASITTLDDESKLEGLIQKTAFDMILCDETVTSRISTNPAYYTNTSAKRAIPIIQYRNGTLDDSFMNRVAIGLSVCFDDGAHMLLEIKKLLRQDSHNAA